MLLTLAETKNYLKIEADQTEDDVFIKSLMAASEAYLTNATGKRFPKSNHLARTFCKIIIADWYENREYSSASRFSESVRVISKCMLIQLRYCAGGDAVERG